MTRAVDKFVNLTSTNGRKDIFEGKHLQARGTRDGKLIIVAILTPSHHSEGEAA